MVTFFHDAFLGSRNFLAIIEPNRIVMHPAIIKRAPASMMREAVSSGPIRKSSYAILIAGEALPHRTQQKIAVSRVTGNHDQMTRVCCCASLTAIKNLLALMKALTFYIIVPFYASCKTYLCTFLRALLRWGRSLKAWYNIQVSLARLGAGFGSALSDIFQTESLRILACLSMRSNAPVEHCVAERISYWKLLSNSR